MLATLTAVLLLGVPAAADRDAPPAKAELFADESWYKQQRGDEKDFVGLLSKASESPATIGVGRFNPYRLTMTDEGKQVVREVYVGAHPEYLAPYVGRKIKLIGKAVDTAVEGQPHAEIWPARVQLMDAPPPAEGPKELPDRLDLLASDKTYLANPTPEKDYVGVLQKKKGEDAVGYVLLIDADDHGHKQDLHLYNQQYALFDPYAGMRVKIVGKKFSGLINGVAQAYILPGRLEVAVVGKPVKELKVLARADWKQVEGTAPVQLAIRSGEDLVKSHGQPPDKATDEAVQQRDVELAARAFKVETIDWKTQMIVVASAGAKPTSGYTVEITGLVVQDDVLTVHWRLNSPKPGEFVAEVFTHPAQAVLTERFDGRVEFDAPPKPAAPPAPGK